MLKKTVNYLVDRFNDVTLEKKLQTLNQINNDLF
jgi:hypothetical protein